MILVDRQRRGEIPSRQAVVDIGAVDLGAADAGAVVAAEVDPLLDSLGGEQHPTGVVVDVVLDPSHGCPRHRGEGPAAARGVEGVVGVADIVE